MYPMILFVQSFILHHLQVMRFKKYLSMNDLPSYAHADEAIHPDLRTKYKS